jgi:protein ImuB
VPRRDEGGSRRVLAIWLPRWPVQRRLCERPELRDVPVFVCRRGRRGTLTVVSWAWAVPPRGLSRQAGRVGGQGTRIPPGTTLAEAMAVLALAYGSRACHMAVVDHDDPVADRVALVRLARWCRRFSPTCGLEAPESPLRGESSGAVERPAPECIHLDVTGTAGFFGGEAALVRTAVWTLAARGLHARATIADTATAARAAARHTDLVAGGEVAGALPIAVAHDALPVAGMIAPGAQPPRSRSWWRPAQRKRRWAVVPPGEAAALLAGLPVSALQLDHDTLATLRELGIDSIGGLLRLPIDSLAARFPPHVARCRARFLGTLAEPWAGLTGRMVVPGEARATTRAARAGSSAVGTTDDDELPRAMESFDVPVAIDDVGEDALVAVIERLLETCVAPLTARGEGILTLQVRLEGGVGRAPAVIDVGLFRPSCSVQHLVDLVRLRLGRCRPPQELAAVAVDVVAAGAALCRQRSLFTTDTAATVCETVESQAVAVGMLLDRLCGRLGRAAVFVPRPVADPQPEHTWVAASPTEPATGVGVPRSADSGTSLPPQDVAIATRRKPRLVDRSAKRTKAMGGFVHGQPGGVSVGGRRPVWMPPRPLPLEPSRCPPLPVAAEMAMPRGIDAGGGTAAGACARPNVRTIDDASPPPSRLWLHGRWYRVAHTHGPERIETAWWRGPSVRRDYYVIETECGERFWLFRCRRGRRWFLHGIFA